MTDPYEEAERLMRRAQQVADEAAAAAGPEPPPRGWDVPRPEVSPFPDLSALLGLVDTLKGTVPPELLQQFADAVRELLVALRAILDYSIARLERPERETVQVEDIPVE